MNAATGIMVLYGTELGEGASVPIAAGNTPIAAPPNSLPAENGLNKSGTAPECMGLAATDKEVFASIYSQNLIQVMDIESGKATRTLTCLRRAGSRSMRPATCTRCRAGSTCRRRSSGLRAFTERPRRW